MFVRAQRLDLRDLIVPCPASTVEFEPSSSEGLLRMERHRPAGNAQRGWALLEEAVALES